MDLQKQQKLLVDARDGFIKFLRKVFPQQLLEEEIMTFSDGSKGYGKIDYNNLMRIYEEQKKMQQDESNATIESMKD